MPLSNFLKATKDPQKELLVNLPDFPTSRQLMKSCVASSITIQYWGIKVLDYVHFWPQRRPETDRDV